MGNLTNQPIKDTYQRLLQVDGGVLQDGYGNAAISVDMSAATITGSITSASYSQTASYSIIALSASFVSGSIESSSFSATASLAITASYALTASYLSGSVQSFPYTGSASITGSLNSYGNISVKEGYLVLENLPEYGDEASAAAGGVPLNGIFRNGNFIVIRLV